jgi:hypothetical protein
MGIGFVGFEMFTAVFLKNQWYGWFILSYGRAKRNDSLSSISLLFPI